MDIETELKELREIAESSGPMGQPTWGKMFADKLIEILNNLDNRIERIENRHRSEDLSDSHY